ncbi:MAG: DinB family protein [Gemmatimonadetes bacterium]|nr:DinB family protein [Gemmatimonadota bacterium]
MSVFTNQASRSAEQAAEYTRAILGLLGERDPLDVLRSTSTRLREIVAGMTDAESALPEAPGKWSIRHVLRHLADSEIVWAYRMRLALAQDRPQLTGYDQDAWADRLGYADAMPADSLGDFEVLRRGNLRLLQAASTEDLKRVGVHTERGEESVAHMMRMYAGHDLLHLSQIGRIREHHRTAGVGSGDG